MNTKNNKRKRDSMEKMESVFMELLQEKELNKITVSDICKGANLNRSTFYANYIDIYDLADKVAKSLEAEVTRLYEYERKNHLREHNFLKLFRHINDNQQLYKTYFKLDNINCNIVGIDTESAEKYFDVKYMDYNIEFFKSGFNAIVKKWLYDGCKESPEEMNEILKSFYSNRR